MTSIEKIKFETKDVIKLIGFILGLSSMWWDLKTDIAIQKEYNKLLEWRVGQLEKKDSQLAVLTPHVCVLPNETRITDEHQ